jgi:hypothetical protein
MNGNSLPMNSLDSDLTGHVGIAIVIGNRTYICAAGV